MLCAGAPPRAHALRKVDGFAGCGQELDLELARVGRLEAERGHLTSPAVRAPHERH